MSLTLAIIVAMESERNKLDPLLGEANESVAAGWSVRTLTREGATIHELTCGIGMANAAAATEYAIQTWLPDVVLNFGCTGAHTREVRPGDVVIGTALIHQGRMIFAPDGSIQPLAVPFTVPGEVEARATITCDPDLVAHATTSAANLCLPVWPGASAEPIVHVGPVASGDVWLQSPTMIDEMHERNGCLCEDMEAQAIGQIATRHGVPFLTIKDISNNEFDVATDFEGSSSPLPHEELGKRSAMTLVATIDAIIAARQTA